MGISSDGEDEASARPAQLLREIDGVFEDLDTLLKNPEVSHELASRGVNASIAMVLGDGFRAYLRGEKERAIEDLGTALDEIAQRYAQKSKGDA